MGLCVSYVLFFMPPDAPGLGLALDDAVAAASLVRE
jgi:hypothetical protein